MKNCAAALGEGGQLPFLEVGEKKLTQSKAIYRFLARKFKLAGADEWEAAKCDELVDAVDDIGAGKYLCICKQYNKIATYFVQRPSFFCFF